MSHIWNEEEYILTGKGEIMFVLLAVMVVLSQLMRCYKQQFYTPVAQNPRMEGHVLNRKYQLHLNPGVNYREINIYYLLASLFSFFSAVAVFHAVGYLAGLGSFLILYSLSYTLVAKVVGWKYSAC